MAAATPKASYENPINFGAHPYHTGQTGALHGSVARLAAAQAIEQAGAGTAGTMFLRGQQTDRNIIARSVTRSSFIGKVSDRDRLITYGAGTKNQEIQHF